MKETTQHNHNTARLLSTVFGGTQFVASVLVVLLVLVSITPSWAGGGKSVKRLWQAGKPNVPALERRIIETAYWKAAPLPGNISAGLGLSTQSARLPEVNPQTKRQLASHVNSGKGTPRLGSNLLSGAFILNSQEEMRPIEHSKYYREMRQKQLEMNVLFTLFRGIRLGDNFIVELKDLLRHGSITTESLNNEIWFTVDITQAVDFVYSLPTKVPVLIALKSREEGGYSGLGTFSFKEDIPAEQQEVFAYLTHQGQAGWYHVSLTSQGEILAVPLDTYIIKILEE